MFSAFRVPMEPDTLVNMITACIRPALDWSR